jgi:hypothetical protein
MREPYRLWRNERDDPELFYSFLAPEASRRVSDGDVLDEVGEVRSVR